MGRELLDLHIGFEQAEPYPLERVDLEGEPSRVVLRADREKGAIVLDDRTTLRGVPPEAWEYQLGSRSALEWVLDQYKERKPRDPTIAERFNTYRFADHKERVIDLLLTGVRRERQDGGDRQEHGLLGRGVPGGVRETGTGASGRRWGLPNGSANRAGRTMIPITRLGWRRCRTSATPESSRWWETSSSCASLTPT